MPYDVTTKDGIVVRGIPDDVSPDDPSVKDKVFRARAQRTNAQFSDRVKGDSGLDSVMLKGTEFDPTNGQSTGSNIAAGFGKAAYDAARGVGQLVGLVSNNDVRESRRRDAPLMSTSGGLGGDIAGNVGVALAPGGILKGAAGVAKAIPSIAQYAPAISALGSTALAPKTLPSALGVGGIFGLAQPAESMGERAVNTGIGMLSTSAIPALKTVKSMTEPFYETGRQQIIGRLLNRVAGEDAPNVLDNLRNAKELVPGSAPTVGQSANNAGIAALERAAFASEPTVTTPVAERFAAQNAARVSALRDLAGSDGARALHAAERDATAQQLYQQAYDKGIDITRDAATGAFASKASQAGIKGEITKLLQRPAIRDAIKQARVLAQNEGVKITDPAGSVKGLDYVKRALDDKIANTTGNEQRILVDLKNRLLTTLDRLSPDYAAARKVFADMSRPINQMDIAEEIAKKSIRPLDETLMPNAYAKALTNDTAARATGYGKATLENTLSPEQLATLDAIKQDLARAEFAKNAGRGVGSDTVQKLAYNNIMQQSGLSGLPNLLSRPVQLAEYGSRMLYGSADKEMRRKLAESLLYPEQAAQMMGIAVPSQNAQRIGGILRYGLTPPLIATPGILNAQQQ